eukprot:3831772-Prymnesium_polylepis.1
MQSTARSTTSCTSARASCATHAVPKTASPTARRRRKQPGVVQAEEAAATDHHPMAISLFTSAIEKNPVDLDAHVGRGLSAAAIGDHERAVYDFSMALQLHPT